MREEATPEQPPVPPLRRLYLYLTEGCNLACHHCWLAPSYDPQGDKHPTLALEAIEQVITEALPLGLISVKLTGGEPLLHPEIDAILDLVGRRSLALVIETNGLLCTSALAAAIARVPDRFVSVSLDGARAATHDALRGVPGAFDKACQAIRQLATAGIAPQVVCTILRSNHDELGALIRLAEGLGAASLKFNLLQPTARGKAAHERNQSPSVNELIALGKRVEEVWAPRTKLQLLFDYPMAFRPLSRIAGGDAGTCGIIGILGVVATGEYALCGIGKHVPDLVFGRVGEQRLEDVWRDSPRLRELRAGLPSRLKGVCAGCLMRHRCVGACLAQNYYRTGSLWEPFWFCEQAAAAGLFPPTRLASGNEPPSS